MSGLASIAYVGIGSNLNDPPRQVRSAIAAIDNVPEWRLVASSSLYSSPPMGPPDQPHYVNAVVELHTALSSVALLEMLQQIERAHGRIRDGVRWGPRTLDLDLLLYDDLELCHADLQIPHPGMKERDFVMLPLVEIAPDLILPCGIAARSIAGQMASCTSAVRLPDA